MVSKSPSEVIPEVAKHVDPATTCLQRRTSLAKHKNRWFSLRKNARCASWEKTTKLKAKYQQ